MVRIKESSDGKVLRKEAPRFGVGIHGHQKGFWLFLTQHQKQQARPVDSSHPTVPASSRSVARGKRQRETEQVPASACRHSSKFRNHRISVNPRSLLLRLAVGMAETGLSWRRAPSMRPLQRFRSSKHTTIRSKFKCSALSGLHSTAHVLYLTLLYCTELTGRVLRRHIAYTLEENQSTVDGHSLLFGQVDKTRDAPSETPSEVLLILSRKSFAADARGPADDVGTVFDIKNPCEASRAPVGVDRNGRQADPGLSPLSDRT